MKTRFAIAVLVIGLAQCVMLLLVGFAPEIEGATGFAHPEFAGMRIGGDGAARIAPISGYSFVFQVLVLLQMHLLVAMGVSGHRHSAAFFGWLGGSLALALFIWWQLFESYAAFLATGETTYLAGFPVATTWLVYPIWLSGGALVLLYVAGFKQYIWSDEDQAAFDDLLAESGIHPQ